MTAGALDGIQVVDLSRVLAGPFATMMLADLGAEVTKVERPGRGDETRTWGPPFDSAGRATYFQSVNRNKRSVALDLADPSDADRARAMCERADVIVENFRPGTLEDFGLGYESLRAANPGLVHCSITGFGAKQGAGLPGYDLLVQATGGLMSITGPEDGGPHRAGVALIDVLAGLFATVGMLAALRRREATGRGQRIEVDLLSSLLAALVNQGSAYTLAGEVAERIGNRHPSIAPYELFEAGSGTLVLAVGNDRQFADLSRVLGRPELARDERFRSNPDRVRNREALRDELVAALSVRDAGEWVEMLSAAGVPAGPVNDIGAAFELAGALGLDPIVEIPRDDGTVARLTKNPIGLSETPPTYRSAPPELPESPGSRPRRRGSP